MSTFLSKLKTSASTATPANAPPKKEPVEQTPLEKMLLNAGPIRDDGTDKFFGLENFGNTCYCNSILQALYHSEPFRTNVVNFPPFSPADTPNGTGAASAKPRKVQVQIRKPTDTSSSTPAPGTAAAAALAAATSSVNGGGIYSNPYAFHNAAGPNPYSKKPAQAYKRPLIGPSSAMLMTGVSMGIGAPGGGIPTPAAPVRPEDKPDTPEYKKKQAMIKGPVLELADNASAYGMEENTFTSVKDIFMAFIESGSRTGVLSPHRLLEIFRRDNELFRTAMHQDAHEFYGLVLNDIIRNVEETALKWQQQDDREGLNKAVQQALGAASSSSAATGGASTPGSGWVHDIFEGVLTSETRCLTCESSSQRDETFLDLSIDLEQHSSVTSCLRKFSAEEMLCERNKFQCDHCGGLQEAEKRMKIKRLPKILALHLKRFKYSEDYTKLEKLFHRVVYPYQLRMFNTTDDAEDADRLYELYAVVVHIGGNAYHGHYVSVIKTAERGWLLFDDEMVEPVDKHYVRNFFGDQPGTACAYVLFYQETTFEKMQAEQEREGLEEIRLASQSAGLFMNNDDVAVNGTNGANNGTNGTHLTRQTTQPAAAMSPLEMRDEFAGLQHAKTAPGAALAATTSTTTTGVPPVPMPVPALLPAVDAATATPMSPADKKHEGRERKEREKKEAKEAKAADKARKLQAKESMRDLERQRRIEADEMRRAIAASRQTAAAEEKQEKVERPEKADKADDPDEREQHGGDSNSSTSAAASTTNNVKSLLSRGSRGSRSTRKPFSFLGGGGGKDRDREREREREREKMPTIPAGEQLAESPLDGTGTGNASAGASAGAHADPPSPTPPPAMALPSQPLARTATASASATVTPATPTQPHPYPPIPPIPQERRKDRFSFGLGRKKSHSAM